MKSLKFITSKDCVFGVTIQLIIKSKKLNSYTLAKQLDTNESSISRKLKGVTSISAIEIISIADAIEVKVDDIVNLYKELKKRLEKYDILILSKVGVLKDGQVIEDRAFVSGKFLENIIEELK